MSSVYSTKGLTVPAEWSVAPPAKSPSPSGRGEPRRRSYGPHVPKKLSPRAVPGLVREFPEKEVTPLREDAARLRRLLGKEPSSTIHYRQAVSSAAPLYFMEITYFDRLPLLPLVRVRCHDKAALIGISEARLLAGQLPSKILASAVQEILAQRTELMAQWNSLKESEEGAAPA